MSGIIELVGCIIIVVGFVWTFLDRKVQKEAMDKLTENDLKHIETMVNEIKEDLRDHKTTIFARIDEIKTEISAVNGKISYLEGKTNGGK